MERDLSSFQSVDMGSSLPQGTQAVPSTTAIDTNVRATGNTSERQRNRSPPLKLALKTTQLEVLAPEPLHDSRASILQSPVEREIERLCSLCSLDKDASPDSSASSGASTSLFADPTNIWLKRLYRERMAGILAGQDEETEKHVYKAYMNMPWHHSNTKAREIFDLASAEEFRNPFLDSWSSRSGTDEGDVSPFSPVQVRRTKSEPLAETVGPFAGFSGIHYQPGVEMILNEESRVVYDEPASYFDDSASEYYSTTSRAYSWMAGDDAEFMSPIKNSFADESKSWVTGDDAAFMSPIENPFAEESSPLRHISSLENLVLDPVFANAAFGHLAAMDVEALVVDFKSTEGRFVDHDHLRGISDISWDHNLDPHDWDFSCGCYHCRKLTYSLDEDEPHNTTWCGCVSCSSVRWSLARAEEEREDEKTRKSWRCNLLAKLKSKPRKAKHGDILFGEIDLKDYDTSPSKDVFDAGVKSPAHRLFDMIKSHLRSPC